MRAQLVERLVHGDVAPLGQDALGLFDGDPAGQGVLQLCGDLGGMLGPLVGTALFAGATELPYALTAVLVCAFIPVALWLRRVERPAS